MKIYLSRRQKYPDYDFSKNNLTYYPACTEVSGEQIDKWNKIKLNYKEMQRELEDIYEKYEKQK
jgi:hypothetical protein